MHARPFVAESLVEAMRREELEGARVLIAAADDARTVLPDGLRALGAEVTLVHPYRSKLVETGEDVDALRAALDAGEVDAVTFTSASTVHGFVAQVGRERLAKVKAISIGPVTSEAARVTGLEVLAEATEATIESLVAAIEKALAS